MSNMMISVFVGLGVAAWVYAKLARSNGNALPTQNYIGAAVAGLLAFTFVYTLMRFVLQLDA